MDDQATKQIRRPGRTTVLVVGGFLVGIFSFLLMGIIDLAWTPEVPAALLGGLMTVAAFVSAVFLLRKAPSALSITAGIAVLALAIVLQLLGVALPTPSEWSLSNIIMSSVNSALTLAMGAVLIASSMLRTPPRK